MANAILSRPGLAQGGSDATQLFLDLFGGEVLTAFHAATQMRETHTVKTLAGGREFKFPLIWQATAAYHTPGAEILGGTIPGNEVVITPDDKLTSSVFIADIDEIMSHFDARSAYAAELAIALAKGYDMQVIRSIVLAARAGAQFTDGYGGTSTGFGANVSTDANTLYNAILDSKLSMENKEVDVDSKTLRAMLRPAQYSLIARSDKFTNRDYNGGQGSVRKNELVTIDGIHILKSAYANKVFGANSTADANVAAPYRANYSNTVATVWTEQAVATAEVQGVSTESEYQVSRQGTLIVARQMTGTRTLRPEGAAEIKNT